MVMIVLSLHLIGCGGEMKVGRSAERQTEGPEPTPKIGFFDSVVNFFKRESSSPVLDKTPEVKSDSSQKAQKTQSYTNWKLSVDFQNFLRPNFLAATFPFSDFAQSVGLLHEAIDETVYNNLYDPIMDSHLFGIFQNSQVLFRTPNTNIVLSDLHHYMSYRFSIRDALNFRKSLTSISELIPEIEKNIKLKELFASLFRRVYEVISVIDGLDEIDGHLRERSRLYFENSQEVSLNLELIEENIKLLKVTMRDMLDFTEANFVLAVPIDKMPFFGPIPFLFDSIFNLILESADYSFVLQANRLIQDILEFQNKDSRYFESKRTSNYILISPVLVHETFLKDLTKMKTIIEDRLDHCAGNCDWHGLTLTNIKKVLFKLENETAVCIDQTVKHFYFADSRPRTEIRDQNLGEKMLTELSKMFLDANDSQSALYVNPGSTLSVLFQSIAKSVGGIIASYKQESGFLEIFMDIYHSGLSLLKSALKRKSHFYLKSGQFYYDYPLVQCERFKDKLRVLDGIMEDSINFDKSDVASSRNFYKTYRSLFELWSLIETELEVSADFCSEKCIEFASLNIDVGIQTSPVEESQETTDFESHPPKTVEKASIQVISFESSTNRISPKAHDNTQYTTENLDPMSDERQNQLGGFLEKDHHKLKILLEGNDPEGQILADQSLEEQRERKILIRIILVEIYSCSNCLQEKNLLEDFRKSRHHHGQYKAAGDLY